MINMTPVKLDSTTYLIWHRQMLHMAECFDLQGFLDGSVVAPQSSLTSGCWQAMLEVIGCSSSHSARVNITGNQYTSFADTRLVLTPIPMFRHLLHQAKQFESMLSAMEVPPTSPAAFSTERGRTINEQHPGGGQNSNSSQRFGCGRGHYHGQGRGNSNPRLNNGHSSQTSQSDGRSGRRPYTPRCQICRGDHYADKCPQFLNARNAIPSAHLAEAFKASCSVAPPADL
ncbi:hypothetical protein SASPL_105899 [Salvia splendens]|uniref:Retrotransposon Copia-like N-terminal domain-containing protein n=1 Tax=Salvia splendens TaxID=180675 RepID=A0A8X8YM95_SALSN|nr:hypothetical protein SASPL_105899 [Salvia splendens]